MTDEPHIGQTKDVSREEVSLSHDIHMTKKQKNGNLMMKMISITIVKKICVAPILAPQLSFHPPDCRFHQNSTGSSLHCNYSMGHFSIKFLAQILVIFIVKLLFFCYFVTWISCERLTSSLLTSLVWPMCGSSVMWVAVISLSWLASAFNILMPSAKTRYLDRKLRTEISRRYEIDLLLLAGTADSSSCKWQEYCPCALTLWSVIISFQVKEARV